MKLGIFDSGLGGLVITKAIRESLPDIDILYYGDTKNLPYGNRSEEAICDYTMKAMEFMFGQGCALIIIACNTACAASLRKLQQVWLPAHYPGRNILGIIVPTLEAAAEQDCKRIGLIATNYSIQANIYSEELKKIDPEIELVQKATPLLVPLIENEGMQWVEEIAKNYLKPLLESRIEYLILGCTHYIFIKSQIRSIVGDAIGILSQDEIMPKKIAEYLKRHPEYDSRISRNGNIEFYVSDITEGYKKAANFLYGGIVNIRKTST